MTYYHSLERYGFAPAAVDMSGNCLTYKDLAAVTKRHQTLLKARELAFVFCENSFGSLISYLSCLSNQVVPVLLEGHMEKDLREELLHIYQPAYVFFPEFLRQEMPAGDVLWHGYNYTICKTAYHKQHHLHPDLALLLSTSGSTGSPKLVRQSYTNIQSNAESIATYLEIDSSERPITTLPMNYTYGLSIINSHLLRGATLLMTDRSIMQRDFWNFFKKQHATSFGGVPYTYEMLKKLHFFHMELPSLRTMTQAGGKLSPQLHQEFATYAQQNGKRFVIMYGQTEATARMAYLPYEMALKKPGSMGIAIPGGRLQLTDVDGSKITTPDTIGELVYYGPNVTLGYAQCPDDLMLGDERNGCLITGDMAKKDEDGYFYIVGRKKRFLKLYGNRVNLDETERLLGHTFADSEIACTGIDDHMDIYVTNRSEEGATQIRLFLAKKTGINSSAFSVHIVTQIPKNEAGKIQYQKLAGTK